MIQQYNLSTPPGQITIVQAQSSDIDTVISILEEAGQWLFARGIHQWLPGSFSRERIASAIEPGEVYLARRGDEANGKLLSTKKL